MQRAILFPALTTAVFAGLLAGCSKDNPENNTPDNQSVEKTIYLVMP